MDKFRQIFSGKPVYFLDNKDFDSNMKFTKNKKKLPMLLMIMGTFCGHCKESAPMYASMAEKNSDNILFTAVIIDSPTDDEKQLGKRLKQLEPKLEGIPAFLLFNGNGNYVSMYDGPRDMKSLLNFIKT
jgi:thiol-disulfide isomerase/thioredoxin